VSGQRRFSSLSDEGSHLSTSLFSSFLQLHFLLQGEEETTCVCLYTHVACSNCVYFALFQTFFQSILILYFIHTLLFHILGKISKCHIEVGAQASQVRGDMRKEKGKLGEEMHGL